MKINFFLRSKLIYLFLFKLYKFQCIHFAYFPNQQIQSSFYRYKQINVISFGNSISFQLPSFQSVDEEYRPVERMHCQRFAVASAFRPVLLGHDSFEDAALSVCVCVRATLDLLHSFTLFVV